MTIATFLARYWPFANGSGRLIDRFARKVDLGEGERVARTTDGFLMHVLANDLIGRHILLSGKFDRSIVGVMLKYSCKGDILLDIGANIGYVTACFLSKVTNSKAICVEPQPNIVDLLHRNMIQFPGRVQIHQAALSDKNGEARFHIDQVNRGASRISDDGEVVVAMIDASELLAPVKKLDIVKIDVEGHELPVFRAMEKELARLRPRAILFEDQTRSAAPSGDIGAILVRLGYRVFGIRKGLFKTSLVPVLDEADCCDNDYLALAI